MAKGGIEEATTEEGWNGTEEGAGKHFGFIVLMRGGGRGFKFDK